MFEQNNLDGLQRLPPGPAVPVCSRPASGPLPTRIRVSVESARLTVGLRVTSLEYGTVAGVRDSHRGQIAITLRPAFGGEKIEIFAGDEHARLAAERYRKGIWCRVEFARTADGKRRDLWARALGPWERTGLIDAIKAAVQANPTMRLDRASLYR